MENEETLRIFVRYRHQRRVAIEGGAAAYEDGLFEQTKRPG